MRRPSYCQRIVLLLQMMCWFPGKSLNIPVTSALDGGESRGMTGQGVVQQEGEGGRRGGGRGRHGCKKGELPMTRSEDASVCTIFRVISRNTLIKISQLDRTSPKTTHDVLRRKIRSIIRPAHWFHFSTQPTKP